MTKLPKDIREWVDTFKGHIVMNLISTIRKDDEFAELFVGKQLDVKVTVNGREFDFDIFAKEVQSQMDDMVNRRAGELVKDQVHAATSDIYDALRDVENELKARVRDLLKHDPWDR